MNDNLDKFLTDLQYLSDSDCRILLEELYRKLYEEYKDSGEKTLFYQLTHIRIRQKMMFGNMTIKL